MSMHSPVLHAPALPAEADAEAQARLREWIATAITVVLTTVAIVALSVVSVALEIG